jgi:hypothetical protein
MIDLRITPISCLPISATATSLPGHLERGQYDSGIAVSKGVTRARNFYGSVDLQCIASVRAPSAKDIRVSGKVTRLDGRVHEQSFA